jgi:3-dehydroquinate synthase
MSEFFSILLKGGSKMEVIKVSSGSNEYNIYIEDGFNGMDELLSKYISKSSNVFIITDNKIKEIYINVIEGICNKFSAKVFSFNEGEESKNYETISRIYDFLIKYNANRNSIIIALGGGVVGDITGFAASTFMRGIPYINIPTTLTAQVDSSIGGKSAYNHKDIKNIVGCFYNPMLVYISTSFLKSLDRKYMLDGMGEVLKYGLITSKELIGYIYDNYEKIFNFDSETLNHIVKECVSIKVDVVNEDFRDTGFRNILNFGHTIGHGIEISSNYSIHHGLAVALGMLSAIKLSEKLLNTSNDIYAYVEDIYFKLGLPTSYKVDNYSSFLYAIKHDKKNLGKINFVLLEEIGICKIKVQVEEHDILWALEKSIMKEA